MLTKNQEAWLKALESGEFKQTHGTLENGESYCCLGVAAKVSGLCGEGPIPGASLASHPQVMDWLGLREAYGAPRLADQAAGVIQLSSLNDHKMKSFKDIAAIVRAHPEEYFVEPEPNHRVSAG